MLMRRLFLLRHAKSSWQTDGQEDFDRPLSERGRASAPQIGAFMLRQAITPDLILCSTACRTRETLACVLPFLRGEAVVRLEDRFYLASAAKLSAALRRLDNAARSVMIVAHNPGIQELALVLSAEDRSDIRQAIESKFPTGALAEIELPLDRWSSVEPHCGTLVRFVTPRSLAAEGILYRQ
jgi:phosphohistidine phosphatase